MKFQRRMALDLIRIAFLLCLFARSSSANCTLTDGTVRAADSVWTDRRGCTCRCVGLEEMHFEQCKHCPAKSRSYKSSTLSTKDMCQYNGFRYFVNETWMSVDEECSECRCRPGGKFACDSDKHCSNTCPKGQVPTYGLCCQVKQCLGHVNGTTYNSIPCWESRRKETIPHGGTTVMDESCIDKFCICYNGIWKCHKFCRILRGASKQWNKLCCPRLQVNESCTFGNMSFFSGDNVYLPQTEQNCTCRSGRIFCDNNSLTFEKSFFHQKSHILYILIVASLTIAILFCIIVIYSVSRRRKARPCRNDNDIKMELLTDITSEPPETPTQMDQI